jgi:hypothetical protein
VVAASTAGAEAEPTSAVAADMAAVDIAKRI